MSRYLAKGIKKNQTGLIMMKDQLEEEQEEETGKISTNQVYSSETTVINHVL